MMAAEVDFTHYMFTGVEGEVIPRNATHFSIHDSVKVIPARAFEYHRNIVELICHAGVTIIDLKAFHGCRSLRRVIIPGVKYVEGAAFYGCENANYIECDKLEIISPYAFGGCRSLSSINLPSAKIAHNHAFFNCQAMTDATFGKKLVGLAGNQIFASCLSLERITLPLKNELIIIDHNDIFCGCRNLKHIDLVERAVLHETVAALQLVDWRNDMNKELDSINETLLNAAACGYDDGPGEKTLIIRDWMERLLRKIVHYKAAHRLILEEAATTLKQSLPNDIVTNSILPFLKLPLHRFDGEGIEEGGGDNSSSDEDSYESSYSSSEEEDSSSSDEDSYDSSYSSSEEDYEEEVEDDEEEDDEEDDEDDEEDEEGDDDNDDSSSSRAEGNRDEEEEEEQDDEGGGKRRKIKDSNS